MVSSMNVHGVKSIEVHRSRLQNGTSLIDIVFTTESGWFTITAFSTSRLTLDDDKTADEQLDEVARRLSEKGTVPVNADDTAVIADMERDAKRYRLLRKFWWNFGTSNYVHEGQIGGKKFWDGLDATHDAETPDQLDAAIDAAIAAAERK